MHNGDDAAHLCHALLVVVAQQGHHLVQLAHQGRQVALDGILIIAAGFRGIGFLQIQYVYGGFVELLVKGLQLGAQGQDGGIGGVGLAVDPLAQHAGVRLGAAGELGIGVQRVAEVAGPFVMSGFRLVAAVQQRVGLLIGFLGPVHADDVDGDHPAEQEHGNQGGRYPDPNASLDTLAHNHFLVFLRFPMANGMVVSSYTIFPNLSMGFLFV